MLTVPQEIKDILHQDSGYKNIRIHFPNGERSDICNDLIVRNSVSFKESLCSQNTLKFGLCEASVFECETVGVGNISGCQIEVFCEVECPPSVTGAEWKTDLQKYIYPIPYGYFIVDDAKRQADMNHRKITAYNILSVYDFKMNKYQLYRANYPNSSATGFSQTLIPLITENMQTNAFQCTETEITSGWFDVYSPPGVFPNQGGNSYIRRWTTPIQSGYSADKWRLYRITANNSNKLYRIVVDNYDEESPYRIVFARFDWATPTSPMSQDVAGLAPFVWDVYHQEISQIIVMDFEYIYPYMSMNSSDNNNYYTPSAANDAGYYIGVRTGYTRKADLPPTPQDVTEISNDRIHLYELTVPDSVYYIFSREKNKNGKYVVANPDKINLRTLFNSYLETCGLFGYLDRTSIFKTLNIKRQFQLLPDSALYPGSGVYPEGVTGGQLLPDDYQTCWYDDDYSKPFGLITCQYKDTNNVECLFELYLTGFDENSDPSTYQTYMIENNELIKNALWTQADIAQICNNIAANIEGVSYMPVEFSGRGLPYVEAGDTFEILTKSNDSITTIVLNRTIKGEQVLEDIYKSV